jgi:predicted transcriptional regulator
MHHSKDRINKCSEKQRWLDTLEALEDIHKGNIVDGDKVHTWLESWGTKHELLSPITSYITKAVASKLR